MKSLVVREREETASPSVAWSHRRQEEARVLRQIEELCDREEPGARIPTHLELMQQLDARERAVIWALDELKRRGRIVRRRGSGTYVGEPQRAAAAGAFSPASASRTIVVIARPDHGFFDDCISELYSHADSRAYRIVYQLLPSQESDEAFEPVLPSAAGYLVFGFMLDSIAKTLVAAGNRVVIVGAPNLDEVPTVPCVCNDHEAGGYLAVRHLLDQGHRRIAFQFNCERELRSPRWLGNRRALDDARRAGLAVTETTFDAGRVDAWDTDPNAARADLARPDSPTAIVSWNDHSAVRVVTALRRAGLSVPGDISVLGYDNAKIAERCVPPLTTIDSGVAQALGVAIRTLQLPVGADPVMIQMTIPNLVVRETVARPKA
jgi:DNA-binding LacI/PurR family transcriptional regulator